MSGDELEAAAAVTVMRSTHRPDESRIQAARSRGLPDTATWDDIRAHNRAQRRQRRLSETGLPETATDDEIEEVFRQRHGERATAAGLPESATPVEIGKVLEMRRCAKMAFLLGFDPSIPFSRWGLEHHRKEHRYRQCMLLMYGLPYGHTKDQFHARYNRSDDSVRLLCFRRLNLPDTATWDEIDQALLRHLVRLAGKHGRFIDPRDKDPADKKSLAGAIGYILNEHGRKWDAYRLGLPVWTADSFTVRSRHEGAETPRLHRLSVLEFGLPDTATWDDINGRIRGRRLHAAVLAGLPETANWNEISDALDPLIPIQA